jgi:hypothetical protein
MQQRLQNILWTLVITASSTSMSAYAEEVDPIISMIAQISEWADKCDNYVSKENCDDGDSTLWNGLICSTNQNIYGFACDAIQNSQSTDGRIWRSPRRVGDENGNSFSRDMSLGVLVYLTATKDQSLAIKWMEYIRRQGALCPEGMSRCGISGRLSDAIKDVYTYIGLSELVPRFIIDSASKQDNFGWAMDARFTSTGYPSHLLAVHLLIRQMINDWDSDKQRATDILYSRQTQNLFFLWLRDGCTYDVRNRVLGLAPVGRPPRLHQWTWERADNEQAWRESMGWDFIFMGERCRHPIPSLGRKH